MKTLQLLLAGFTAFFMVFAHADMSVRSKKGDSVILTEMPCPPEIAVGIKPEFWDQFRFAFTLLNGVASEACWILDGDDVYVWVDSETGFAIPQSSFKIDNGV